MHYRDSLNSTNWRNHLESPNTLNVSGPQERPCSSDGTRSADKNATEGLMLEDPFRDSDGVSRSDSYNQFDGASVGDETSKPPEFAIGTSTPFESAIAILRCFRSSNQVPTPWVAEGPGGQVYRVQRSREMPWSNQAFCDCCCVAADYHIFRAAGSPHLHKPPVDTTKVVLSAAPEPRPTIHILTKCHS
jgi:hypothetical protein